VRPISRETRDDSSNPSIRKQQRLKPTRGQMMGKVGLERSANGMIAIIIMVLELEVPHAKA
jgi:hypothetical protein